MEAKAYLRNARIAPRKVQVVLDLIRNKPLDVALATLNYTPKAACEPLLKLVNSAAANAVNNFDMNRDDLYIAECYVCPGPIMKRIRPRAQGRAYRILKRTSHVTIVLKEKKIDPKGGLKMGQKVNPHGLRVGIIKDWDSRWFANKSTFGDTLVEDYNVRNFIKKNLYAAGVPKIEIERFAEDKVRIHIHCAKPGIVIGRGGTEIEKLRLTLEKMMGKQVAVNIVEVKNPDINSKLVAEKIALDLENRVSFRRTMKQAIGRAMRLGAKGIKVSVSGRLGGAEIARSETYHEGTIPLQTIRADIDYATAEAATTYGRLGIKVWIYKGEVLKGDAAKADEAKSKFDNKDNRRRAPRRRNNNDRPAREVKNEGGNQ